MPREDAPRIEGHYCRPRGAEDLKAAAVRRINRNSRIRPSAIRILDHRVRIEPIRITFERDLAGELTIRPRALAYRALRHAGLSHPLIE